jgi:hypothetical protein
MQFQIEATTHECISSHLIQFETEQNRLYQPLQVIKQQMSDLSKRHQTLAECTHTIEECLNLVQEERRKSVTLLAIVYMMFQSLILFIATTVTTIVEPFVAEMKSRFAPHKPTPSCSDKIIISQPMNSGPLLRPKSGSYLRPKIAIKSRSAIKLRPGSSISSMQNPTSHAKKILQAPLFAKPRAEEKVDKKIEGSDGSGGSAV